ncbi:hypothetical protein Tery_4261 [Trichodesmium erythraeum IMS101]|uniref:Uncharacterized protein n=1 Tax=Trichodesmium erythraeum (strain IMS101) TaxID=203124 RepID=Q10WW5_TRIEI|nr:hypothetical protein [Trichodesmium erythraeum GBRTRLIN201]
MTEELINLTWKSVSDINNPDNPKRRGWLIPLDDLDEIKRGTYCNKTVVLKLDNLNPQQIVLSDYMESKDRVKLRETQELTHWGKEYKLRPIIYRKPKNYFPKTEHELPADFLSARGVIKRGEVYVAFIYQTSIKRISTMNLFTVLE